MQPSAQSYEAHIALSADVVSVSEGLAKLCKSFMFRYPAQMQTLHSTEVILTGNSDGYEILEFRMHKLMDELVRSGYTIARYKIEAILLDVRPGP